MDTIRKSDNPSSFSLDPAAVVEWLVRHDAALVHASVWQAGLGPQRLALWAVEGALFAVTMTEGPSAVKDCRVYAPVADDGLSLDALLAKAQAAKRPLDRVRR